ncbi:MAG: quinoprotein dehydrogenase-associated SoxYZ-like carrier [Acetobacteraceae bacterium]|nr:quinoprotein dehydrogenase-associated SoxYZ-like carrier [Acetobacteraceae bacterium]
MPRPSRRPFLLGAASLAMLPAVGGAREAAGPASVQRRLGRWEDLKAALFDGRITEHAMGGAVELAVPRRAADAASVPVSVTILSHLAPRLRALWLVVDENPAPLAVHAEPGPMAGGFRSFSTVVRVDRHSLVHAVAELKDGRLLEVSSFVEATRGFSAPLNTDFDAARDGLGRMRIALPGGPPAAGRPVPVQLTVSHPNTTGMQLDHRSRAPLPVSFLRKVEVRYRGAEALRIEAETSVAEDPVFGFTLSGEPGGELRVDAEDSDGRRFRGAWTLGATG